MNDSPTANTRAIELQKANIALSLASRDMKDAQEKYEDAERAFNEALRKVEELEQTP